jgi:preprotein translocase subunit SecG
MSTLVTILHVAVCLFLMVTVLLQSGKGGGVGAAFGAGGSQTVFGGSGGGNFLRRMTVACAAIFMLTSITLAYMASSTGSDSLRRYADQQRQLRESMEQTRQEALQGDEGAATPEQPATPTGGAVEGEGAVEGTEEGAAVEGGTAAPEGAEGAVPAGEQPAGEQPAGEATPDQPSGATQDQTGGAAPAPTPAPAGQGAPPTP